MLVVLDDGSDDRARAASSGAGSRRPPTTTTYASRRSPRADGEAVARYAALLATGMYAAAYLRVGLEP